MTRSTPASRRPRSCSATSSTVPAIHAVALLGQHLGRGLGRRRQPARPPRPAAPARPGHRRPRSSPSPRTSCRLGRGPLRSHASSRRRRIPAHSAGSAEMVLYSCAKRPPGHRARLAAAADDQRRPRLLQRLGQCLAAGRAGSACPRTRTRPRSTGGGRSRAAPPASPSARRPAETGSRRLGARARTSPRPAPARPAHPRRGRPLAALAVTEGWRKVAGETIVPSRIRCVRAAIAASVVQASRSRDRLCRSRTGSGRNGTGPRGRSASLASASAIHCSQETPSWPSIIRHKRTSHTPRSPPALAADCSGSYAGWGRPPPPMWGCQDHLQGPNPLMWRHEGSRRRSPDTALQTGMVPQRTHEGGPFSCELVCC